MSVDELVRIMKERRLVDEADRASRAPSTLSERIRETAGGGVGEAEYVTLDYMKLHAWADEVGALEARLQLCLELLPHGIVFAQEDSPTDILKHNYEKLGLSSALRGMGSFG